MKITITEKPKLDIKELEAALDKIYVDNISPRYLVMNSETLRDTMVEFIHTYHSDKKITFRGIDIAVCEALSYGEIDIVCDK